MTTDTQTTEAEVVTFTAAEREALRRVRRRHSETRDLFSPRELARLQFVKWLAHNGRLDS